jgi:hypothetical protein
VVRTVLPDAEVCDGVRTAPTANSWDASPPNCVASGWSSACVRRAAGLGATLAWPPQTDRGAHTGDSEAAVERERLVAFITGGILATLPAGAGAGAETE